MAVRLEQNQKAIMSQKMLQAVNILQMSSLELTDFIKEAALENPVIDFADAEPADEEQERLKKLEWLASLDEQNRSYYQYDQEDADENLGTGNLSGRTSESLEDFLHLQLLGRIYPEAERRVCEFVLECLDSNGFFTGTANEVSAACHTTLEEAKNGLAVMRSLEPAGVCAGSVQECLLKQLEGRADCGELERQIVSEYMELLSRNQLHLIAKYTKRTPQEVAEAAARIKSLNPRPAQGFDNGELLKYIVPDVTVVKFKGRLEILLNNYACPVLHVNKEYLRMMKSDCGSEVKEYLSTKVRQAEEIQSHITRRSSTLLSLAECIVDVQREFFMTGGGLRPFRLVDAAERMKCHESTVSRAVRDKYLQCCWGVYPLGYFFQKGTVGQEETAVVQIKQQIRTIIDKENKEKPYSDEKIAALLKEQGMEIPRRTVAKYREDMKIANCRGRKVFA
ncbi:MAG: RNA polymerase factor sigma-54 [Lachnospiraceae bacterium]|nr:RNA polymerase factor sigma-54 [Lachnospiraceae bacterium]